MTLMNVVARCRFLVKQLTDFPSTCQFLQPIRGSASTEKVGWKRDGIDEQKVYLTIVMSFLFRNGYRPEESVHPMAPPLQPIMNKWSSCSILSKEKSDRTFQDFMAVVLSTLIFSADQSINDSFIYLTWPNYSLFEYSDVVVFSQAK